MKHRALRGMPGVARRRLRCGRAVSGQLGKPECGGCRPDVTDNRLPAPRTEHHCSPPWILAPVALKGTRQKSCGAPLA